MNKIPKTENLTVEFKSSFDKEVIETLVAFSNAKGGIVYIGVSDKRKVQGITIGKESIQNWINEIKNKTTPQIIPDAEVLSFENKIVVTLSVPEYPIKPVSTQGRYYKRINASNHLLSANEVANMHLQTINSSWDYYPRPNKTIKDISLKKVRKVMNAIKKRNENFQIATEIEFLKKNELLGVLPDTIMLEQLRTNQYVSTPRNRQVARIIKEMGIVERYGTGIKRVRKMLVDYGLKEPSFEIMSGGIAVTVYGKSDLKSDLKNNDIDETILYLMNEDNQISIPILAEKIGRGITITKRRISKLKASGLIRRVGADKGGYWKVIQKEK